MLTTPRLGRRYSPPRWVPRPPWPDCSLSPCPSTSAGFLIFLSFPRAAETLGILLLVVVTASLALVPQVARALGVEVVLVGLLFAGVTLRVQVTHGPDSPDDPRSWFASRVAVTSVPSVCFIVGGGSLAAHAGGGIYWLVPGTLLAFVGAAYNAWVLLVEVIRQKPG